MNFWLVFLFFVINFCYVFYVIKLERSNILLQETLEWRDPYSILEQSCQKTLNTSFDCNFPVKTKNEWNEIPNICLLFASKCKNSLHFLGEQENLNLFWSDFLFLDFVLTKHFEYKRFIEIGTNSGIQSLYFGLLAKTRRGKFHTFDEIDKRSQRIKNGWLDNMIFHKIHFENQEKQVLDSIKNSNVLLFSVKKCKLFQKILPKMNIRSVLFLDKNFLNDKCFRMSLSKNYFSDVYKSFSNHFASQYQSFVKIR